MCNFPFISSKSVENESLIRFDYYSGNLLVYNLQNLTKADEYSFIYDRGLSSYQTLLRYGYTDSLNINAIGKIYIDLPDSIEQSQIDKIVEFLKKIDVDFNQNHSQEFIELKTVVPFHLTNNEKSIPLFLELLKILENDSINEGMLKIFSKAENIIFENIHFNRNYSSIINTNKKLEKIYSFDKIKFPEIVSKKQ